MKSFYYLVILILLFAVLFIVDAFGQFESHPSSEGPVIHQLRIYEIPENNLQVFHERFRDHAHRIMKKYDFNIVSIWESKSGDKVEFVYLLEWENQEKMKQAWRGFMQDQEWKDIKEETSAQYGTFVENIEDRTLLLTEYSPQKGILNRKNKSQLTRFRD